jgi:recombinational DNA repair protein RecR
VVRSIFSLIFNFCVAGRDIITNICRKMMQRYAIYALLIGRLVQGYSVEKESRQTIQNHINSLTPKLGKNICDGQTCCNVTSTEKCSISSMTRDQSTLVLPGGDTRCIYSTSTPFAFQVFII